MKILENPIIKQFIKKLVGFSFVGIGVTLLSMFITFLLLKVFGVSAYLTYFISYATTILISYYLNSRLVFKSGKSIRNLFLYYVVYCLSMLIGLGTLALYRLFLPFDELILNYMVIPVTLTWNFLVSSRILKQQENNGQNNNNLITSPK